MSDRTSGPWPIRQWLSKTGGGFTVEDGQYNFSFDTRKQAEDFRTACFEYQKEMATRQKTMTARFKEELFS